MRSHQITETIARCPMGHYAFVDDGGHTDGEEGPDTVRWAMSDVACVGTATDACELSCGMFDALLTDETGHGVCETCYYALAELLGIAPA